MRRIKLTKAQISALECAGLFDGAHDLTNDEDILRLSFQGNAIAGAALVISPSTQEAIARAVNELSNSEDMARLNGGRRDPMAVHAARASRALSALYGKVLAVTHG